MKQLKIHGTIPLPADAFDEADMVAKAKPVFDAFKEGLLAISKDAHVDKEIDDGGLVKVERKTRGKGAESVAGTPRLAEPAPGAQAAAGAVTLGGLSALSGQAHQRRHAGE
jgi:hypothetical protein